MSNKFKFRLLSVFFIIFLCISVTIKEICNDTFYVIKLGEFIRYNGIDFVDHYSWIENLTYTYPHWLYDLFIYIIYANFDFSGVYISTIILFIILILSIYIINLKINKNEVLSFLFSILSVVCLATFAMARAHLVSAILFLWQVYFIEKLILNGKVRYIVYLILISFLIANLHATIWLLTFVLYLPFIVEHFVSLVVKSRFFVKNFFVSKLEVNSIKYFKKLILAFILSFFAGFLSPSKICFTYVFRVMGGNSQSYIMEHAPTVIIEHPCFMAFVFVGLLILVFSSTKIKLRELFMISGFILMVLISGCHLALFYIIGALYLSILCNRYLKDSGDKTFDSFYFIIIRNKFIYIGLIIICLLVSFFKFNDNFSGDYIPKKNYPVGAVGFIKSNLDVDNMHLYNEYNVGSYLLFNDIPVFIDSRCDLYLKEFNGLDYSIFDDAVNMSYNYEEKFEFYDVTHVLISNDTMFYKVLSKDSAYDVLYHDEYFTLFEGGNGES